MKWFDSNIRKLRASCSSQLDVCLTTRMGRGGGGDGELDYICSFHNIRGYVLLRYYLLTVPH